MEEKRNEIKNKREKKNESVQKKIHKNGDGKKRQGNKRLKKEEEKH